MGGSTCGSKYGLTCCFSQSSRGVFSSKAIDDLHTVAEECLLREQHMLCSSLIITPGQWQVQSIPEKEHLSFKKVRCATTCFALCSMREGLLCNQKANLYS